MGSKWRKSVNLATAIIDFAMALVMLMVVIKSHSLLAAVFCVAFAGMGIYFLRFYERQRRLDSLTDEERAEYFRTGVVPDRLQPTYVKKEDQ